MKGRFRILIPACALAVLSARLSASGPQRKDGGYQAFTQQANQQNYGGAQFIQQPPGGGTYLPMDLTGGPPPGNLAAAGRAGQPQQAAGPVYVGAAIVPPVPAARMSAPPPAYTSTGIAFRAQPAPAAPPARAGAQQAGGPAPVQGFQSPVIDVNDPEFGAARWALPPLPPARTATAQPIYSSAALPGRRQPPALPPARSAPPVRGPLQPAQPPARSAVSGGTYSTAGLQIPTPPPPPPPRRTANSQTASTADTARPPVIYTRWQQQQAARPTVPLSQQLQQFDRGTLRRVQQPPRQLPVQRQPPQRQQQMQAQRQQQMQQQLSQRIAGRK